MSESTDISRRKFLARTAATGGSLYLLPHALGSNLARADDGDDDAVPESPDLGFFTDDERATVGALANQILPGAAHIGAVAYIETLLTAFDTDPPKIYAGGPFSGRAPYAANGAAGTQFPQNSFTQFCRLSRVQEAAWKLRLYGSSAFPGGAWNDSALGATQGLRDFFKEQLPKAVNPDNGNVSFDYTLSAFEDTMRQLVVESAFSAPEYGGNQDLRGWKLAYFPGDVQPLGYSIYDEADGKYHERPDAPVSTLDAEDPNSMGFWSKAFCFFTAIFEGGKVF